MDQAGEVETLLQATSLLVHTTSPERATAILRSAIQRLAKPEAPDKLREGVSRTAFPKTASVTRSWEPVRVKLCGAIEARGAGTAIIASEIGITRRQLQRAVSPRGRLPGTPTRTKIEGWLRHVRSPRSNEKDADPAPTPSTASRAPAGRKTAGNGHTSLPPYRLTEPQRNQLSGFLSLDERELRKTVGCTHELLNEAVAGHDLDPLIIGRLQEFLLAPTG